jgi:hypothetical protein
MTVHRLGWNMLSLLVLALASDTAAQERGPVGTVTLTRPEYDRLVDLAGRQMEPPEAPPSAAALSKADLRVRVDGATAVGTIALRGEVLGRGVFKVPLIAGATLIDARSDDRPVPLLVENNVHTAVVAGPSTFSTVLGWASSVSYAPGRGSFALRVPASGSAAATIDVPGERSDVQVSPGLVLRRFAFNGRTVIDVSLEPGSNTQVSWSARDAAGPAAQAGEVRLLSAVKSLVTIGETDVRLLSVIDVTVLRGAPAAIEVRLPSGYELAGVSGATLERSETGPGQVTLVVRNSELRRHQFVIGLERAHGGGSFTLETAMPDVPAAQRVSGEVAIEGVGTLEVSGAETPGLRRVDVREIDRTLISNAARSLLAAYRYQRTTSPAPTLALSVARFADAPVLAAVAERAVATTLVTSEGRTLTEIIMWVRNRAQPYVRVSLPEGASIVSVEVAGEPASPVEGPDGTRVPLLRQGFRPNGPYVVSYVYMHAGTPFQRRGDMEMALPRMDLPVSLVEWELFVPERYRADRFDGNMIDASLLPHATTGDGYATGAGAAGGAGFGGAALRMAPPRAPLALPNGSIGGYVVDPGGAPLPGVTIVVSAGGASQTAVTDANGRYIVSGVRSGPNTVTAALAGLRLVQRSLTFDQRPQQVDVTMEVEMASETVTVQSSADAVRAGQAARDAQSAPSANVQSLQRRAAGVLPIRIDVPRAGTSHRFVKPLVIDEETIVTFRYRTR